MASVLVFVSVFVSFKILTPSDNCLDMDRGFLASCLLCGACLCVVVLSYVVTDKIVFEIEIDIDTLLHLPMESDKFSQSLDYCKMVKSAYDGHLFGLD